MIKIDDKFFIDADSNSYTLKEKDKIQDKKSKNYGEEVFRDRGYYVTLEGVLNGYLKAQTREFVQNKRNNCRNPANHVIHRYLTLSSYLCTI